MAKLIIELDDTKSASQVQSETLGGADSHVSLRKLITYLQSKMAGAGSDAQVLVRLVDESAPKSLTNSAADPTVVTRAAHGLTSGDLIQISGSNSTPSLNGIHKVTVLTPNTFTVPVAVTVAGTQGSFLPVEVTTAGELVATESYEA